MEEGALVDSINSNLRNLLQAHFQATLTIGKWTASSLARFITFYGVQRIAVDSVRFWNAKVAVSMDCRSCDFEMESNSRSTFRAGFNGDCV
jgi:hypothetical protein